MNISNDQIRVLIIDDSEMVCKIFSQELAKDPAITVVGSAPDPIVAREKIARLKPDVLVLDIEMPKMDGLTFLENLMQNYPLPVIIVSSLAKAGSAIAFRALEIGAADVMAKPGPSYSVKEMSEQLIEKIKDISQLKQFKGFSFPNLTAASVSAPKPLSDSNKIIAIGASTGGIGALTELLLRLPKEVPPILVVQHMSPYFLTAFAERLNHLCLPEVREAGNGEKLAPGKILLAPGNKHMVLKKNSQGFYVEVKAGPLVLHQRPSIEVLFRSVAMYAGADAIGILLAGTGVDGAQGLSDMKNAGAFTITQDEASSLIYGLPKEAVRIGAVCVEAPLAQIPQIIVDHL
ncbi:MAG: protein-glutamate methylesterase/protein-glutamine glutaminase [Bacillota bacterium]